MGASARCPAPRGTAGTVRYARGRGSIRMKPQERAQAADAAAALTMPDGQALFLRDWPNPSAREAVLIVHGLGEHSGRYEQLAQWFLARGYAVRSYDQRGHGHTPGPRAALRH